MKVHSAAAGLALAALAGCIQPTEIQCGAAGQACCSGAMCKPGSECASDNVCRACGGDGESCCANQVCSPGGECRADGQCHTCGAAGQSCCANNTCQAALRCDNGGCVTPCGDGCAPGERRCNANGGVDLCGYDGPPCTSWSVLLSRCPADQTCTQGACTDRCPNPCTLGSYLCTAEGLQVCVLDDASQCPVYKVPPASPDNPTCMTGACADAICWESPLPQGNELLAITGWAADQWYVLDGVGNILRRNTDTWSYDYRDDKATSLLPAVHAVRSCNLPTMAFAVGRRGAVLRRNSAGWVAETSGATADFAAVSCDVAGVVAVGAGGAMYARDDAGSWRPLTSPTTANLRGVARYFSLAEAWAVGDAGTIVHCTDLDTPNQTSCVLEGSGVTSAPLSAVFVNGQGEVWAVGAGGVILERTPVGDWMRVGQGVLGENLTAVFGLDDGSVYVAGENGAFAFKLGSSWIAESFTTGTLRDLYAPDSTHLFAVGDGAALWFNDAGGSQGPAPQQHWRQLGGAQPSRADFNAVAGTGASDVFAVADAGAVLHKSGDAWRVEARDVTTEDLTALTIVSPDELYAVGTGGTVLARRSGLWAKEGAGVTANPLLAAYNDGTTVYATGANGAWIEKPVGSSGNLWHLVSTPLSTYLMAMAGGAPGGVKEVWAFGAGCAALRKTGSTIEIQNIPGCSDDIMAAAETDDGDLYIGGFMATVYHRVAGVWDREYLSGSSLETVRAFAIHGSDVWAVSESGELYHRTAGNWTQEAQGLTYTTFTGAYATPEGQVFLVGTGGLIWHRR